MMIYYLQKFVTVKENAEELETYVNTPIRHTKLANRIPGEDPFTEMLLNMANKIQGVYGCRELCGKLKYCFIGGRIIN